MHDRQSWVAELLNELGQSGSTGRETEQYLRARKIRIGVRNQSSGARWTLGRRIDLNPRYLRDSPNSPYALSLVVHEMQHLKQGPLTALSIYGELEAWQTQFRFLLEIAGGYPGVPGQAAVIRDLLQLPLGWDRFALQEARGLMRQYAGRNYRVDLLPLYPLHDEILYCLVRRRPRSTAVP
jgi:hypothetical protein